MASKSGNGSQSPFGNGSGATSSGSGKPVDLIKDPSGGRKGGGVDLIKEPDAMAKRALSRMGKPEDLTDGSRGPDQKEGEAPDLNKESVPDGGKIKLPDGAESRKEFLGTGSMGNTHKPFKLKSSSGGDSGSSVGSMAPAGSVGEDE